ncbi:1,4-dihydroxy-2-naphthoate polyprenyltransferase [candidate division GN15 bacterium]|nr:1,4-dihydroxy-2-naphthoate polyprenyltransferase [candidate division GN15 bacterium]
MNVWLLAARPKTLPAALAPVVIGTAMAWSAGAFHLWSAVAAGLGAILIQIGTNFANDYYDYTKGTDTEDRLGPLRVTSAGMVKPSTMKTATIVVFALALLVGAYLVWRGGWPIVIIGLMSILFGILYTAGPYPLGYNGLGDIFVLIFFGPVAVGGTYYVQALTVTWPAIVAGLGPGLLSVAILVVNNVRDLDNDRAAGKRTLAVSFGRNFSVVQYVFSVVSAMLVPVVLSVLLDDHYWSLLAIVAIVPAIPAMQSVARDRGRILNNTLAATGRVLLIYSILFAVGWVLV